MSNIIGLVGLAVELSVCGFIPPTPIHEWSGKRLHLPLCYHTLGNNKILDHSNHASLLCTFAISSYGKWDIVAVPCS